MAMIYLEGALREMQAEKARANWIEAITDYMDKHVAMVAKLRKLSVDMGNAYDGDGVCVDFSNQLDAVLSAEPAPPAPVDIATVREVISDLTFTHPGTATQRRCIYAAERLIEAIGDTK